MSYNYFRTNRSEVAPPRDLPVCLHDEDGAVLYEDDFRGFRMQIIKLNDVATLKQYIAKDPVGALAPADLFYHDPYFIAAKHGSTDTLRLLLETHNSDMTRTKSLDERRISLLDIACHEGGDTALLHAAPSLERIDFEDFEYNNHSPQWVRDRIARSEDLMQLLLDRGASARDSNTVGLLREHYNKEKSQPRDTVLGLAITRASYGLVRRLINEGADIHRKDWYQRELTSNFGGDCAIDAQNVTMLHISSLYWNVDAIKALFDHGELLLAHGAIIGSVDMNGDTALHIMAKNLRQVEAARFLISNGANVAAVNAQGNTPVHEVMTGLLQAKRPARGQKYPPVRLADRLRAQDDMIAVIQDGSGYDDKLMDQPNAAGKTPGQMLEETRTRWQKVQ
ncbi:hypothetical protein ZTR_10321 [Talaromyces verruculosus]|nr:hypothetical protein ZTR_10321 [Talaromyces verruculosus]